ncbi:MAG: Crp/Fnr family transcriptional regulator [Pseudomonadota bacterium]
MNATPSANTAYKIRLLQAAGTADGVEEADVDELARCAQPFATPQGRAPGAKPNENALLIETGAMALTHRLSAAEKPALISVFGPNDLCTALPPARKNTGTFALRTLTNCTGLSISKADLERVARRSPEFSARLGDAGVRVAANAAASVSLALRRPLENRLANFLSRVGDCAVRDDWRPSVSIGRLSQSLIGDLLGVSREHINRTFGMWEKSGVIFQANNGSLVIEDRRRLAALAADVGAAARGPRDTEWLSQIDRHLDLGLNVSAFHLAVEAAKRTPKDARYRHRAVLATARAGSSAEALTLFTSFGLSEDDPNDEIACLRPRILRDMALSVAQDTDDVAAISPAQAVIPDRLSDEQAEMLKASADGYAKAFERSKSYYAGVNAAAGSAMLGELEKAAQLAKAAEKAAQEAIDKASADDWAAEETDPSLDDNDSGDLSSPDEMGPEYFALSAAAECALIKGDQDGAAVGFAKARAAFDATSGKRAATRKQLFRLRTVCGIDDAWIDTATPQKRPLYFCGPMAAPPSEEQSAETLTETIRPLFDDHKIGWASGALAAGADIIFAEACLEAGVPLHVTLPCEPGAFLVSSVKPFGGDWTDRFADCMRRAQTIDWNRRENAGSDAAYSLAATVAMGRTVRQADALQTTPLGIFALRDGGETLSHRCFRTWQAQGFDAIDAHVDWAQPQTPGKCVETTDHFAVIASEPDTSCTDLLRNLSDAFIVEDGLAAALFSAPQAAFDCAQSALKIQNADTKLRLWLDVGVVANTTKDDGLDASFLMAACRPATSTSRVFASEAFAFAASLTHLRARHFEYVGFAPTTQKVAACPIYAVC